MKKYTLLGLLLVLLLLGVREYTMRITHSYLEASLRSNQAAVISVEGIQEYIANMDKQTVQACYNLEDIEILKETQKQIALHVLSVKNEQASVIAYVDDLVAQKQKNEVKIASTTASLYPESELKKLADAIDAYTAEINAKNSLIDLAKKRDLDIRTINTNVQKYRVELPQLKSKLVVEQKRLTILPEIIAVKTNLDAKQASMQAAYKAFQASRPNQPKYMSLYQAYITANSAYQNANYMYTIKYQQHSDILNTLKTNSATSTVEKQKKLIEDLTAKIGIYELSINNLTKNISDAKAEYTTALQVYLKTYTRTEKEFAEPVSKLVTEKQKVEKRYGDMRKKNDNLSAQIKPLADSVLLLDKDIEQYSIKKALYKELLTKLEAVQIMNTSEIQYAATHFCAVKTPAIVNSVSANNAPVESALPEQQAANQMGQQNLCGNGSIDEGEECDGSIASGYYTSCQVECWPGYEKATRGFFGRVFNSGDVYCKRTTQNTQQSSAGQCKPPVWGVGGNVFGITVNPQNLNPCPRPNEGESMCLNGWEVDYSYQGENRTWRCVLYKYEACGNDVKQTYVAERFCSAS